MSKRKPASLKGMTILENLIAFTLITAALAIMGTGFYISANLVSKGRMYEEAADAAQCIMDADLYYELTAAFKKTDGTGYNAFDSTAVQNRMQSLGTGYELSSDGSCYYNKDNWVVIKPCSSSDGDFSASAELNMNGVSTLKNFSGMYIYVCVPVDPNDVKKLKSLGYSDTDAIGISDYVPLACYIGE